MAGAIVTLALGACSAGSAGSGIANLPSTTSTTSPSGSTGSAPKGDTFSACMRAHGVPLFPDPNMKGAISPGPGVDPNSAQFQRANQVCHPLLPSGGGLSTQEGGRQLTPSQQAQLLKYAQCMRTNGVANFPDPGSSGLVLGEEDPTSPQFQKAQAACKSLLPQGGTHQTTGGAGVGGS